MAMQNKKSRRLFSAGNNFLIPYLTFLGAFAPLSTDMYLPALPTMANVFQASNDVISLTISGFMCVFALSMLIWGSLSDRYGRRPVLLCGSAIFIISSIAIAVSTSLASLLIWRAIQALGSGAASAMSLAIVKDILRGERMEKIVGWMQAVTILAPLLAPVIGGGMLLFVNWRGIFWCLALCGAIAFAGALALRETGTIQPDVSPIKNFGRIGVVLKMVSFRRPLIIFSAMAMPFMAYLALSAFIYQDVFGVSPQAYSLFFAFIASASLLGPFAHIYFLRHFPKPTVLGWHLGIMSVAGLFLTLFGNMGPWYFALLFLPINFCGSALRPPSTVLMMQIVEGDNGVVASLINCGGLLAGSLSMVIATLPFWPGPVFAVGTIATVIALVCCLAWLRIRKDYQGI